MSSYRKVKSVAKTAIPKSAVLERRVLSTMRLISEIVGATLGPGGCPVLIERQNELSNMVTKDGVTAFKALGFTNEIDHAIMETARDASVRTAVEAGDGTTTATVLSEAFVRYTHDFCKKNPKVSSQKTVRTIEKLFRDTMEPRIAALAQVPNDEDLYAVAKCSANGDDELATAVMQCFRLVGDDGNITIIERSGPSGYEVEALKGYPVGLGYEESCRRFFPLFINDRANSRVYMERPLFVLYFGTITEIQTLYPIMAQVQAAREANPRTPHNVIIAACGFSETVLGHLSSNWTNPETLNIYPMVIPKTPEMNSEMHFLQDLQAVTGARIFDPVTAPIERGSFDDLGMPLEYFEALRYRSNIVGQADEGLVLIRVEELRGQLAGATDLVKMYLNERIGKLTGGIAKLTVIGASNGEIREKRDRAEDAACAVRGARKHGYLPGGGWGLMKLAYEFQHEVGAGAYDVLTTDIINDILIPGLLEPVQRIMSNAGLNDQEIEERVAKLLAMNSPGKVIVHTVWDGITDTFVDSTKTGIVDSTPAVLEALRSSISVATLLGTLGAVIVFPRDVAFERQEASDTYQFLRDAGYQVEEK